MNRILLPNKESSNGYVYPKEVRQSIVNQIKEKLLQNGVFSILGAGDTDLMKITHKVKDVSIDGNDEISVELEKLDIFKDLPDESTLCFRPFGMGTLKEREIYDYTLININTIPKNLDSFGEE